MKFKIEDRVVCTEKVDGNDSIINKTGTIVNFNRGWNSYFVKFDENINDGHDTEGLCWWVPENSLKRKDVKITITIKEDAIKANMGKKYVSCKKQEDIKSSINSALDMLFDSEIKVGDTVKVTNYGYGYSSYATWVTKNAPAFAVYYQYGSNNIDDKCTYKVVAKAEHSFGDDHMLYLIQKEDNKCYLIREKGIKKV